MKKRPGIRARPPPCPTETSPLYSITIQSLKKMNDQKQAFHDIAKRFVETVTNASPILLCATLAATFFMYAQFQSAYYITIFTPKIPTFAAFAGYGIATVFFMVRLVLGIATANNFYDGRNWAGIMNLLLSISAAVFEVYESDKMAAMWGAEFSAPTLALNIGGLMLELALIFTVLHKQEPGKITSQKRQESEQMELPFFTQRTAN